MGIELLFLVLRLSGAFKTRPDIPPATTAKIGLVIAFKTQSNTYIVKATPRAAAGATLGLDQVLAGYLKQKATTGSNNEENRLTKPTAPWAPNAIIHKLSVTEISLPYWL